MILQQIDKLYYRIPKTSFILRVLRYAVRVFANMYVRYFMRIKGRKQNIDEDTIIVSLTSFPARIKNVWMTCATLLNQDIDNIQVILWLSRMQFPNEEKSLPEKLLNLRNKGLDIRFVDDDLRPHKKYFYALKAFPDNIVITVDDDILYSPQLVPVLIDIHDNHLTCVICNRGITLNKSLYKSWVPNKIYGEERTDIMPTGIGGVLYPPHIFDRTPIFNVEVIKQTCLNGDDLWLNFMARLGEHRVVQTGIKTGLVTILSSQKSALYNSNIGDNRNDVQIGLLSQWAMQNLNCDFYINLQ